jgi:F-box/leucine-rich repeat protein 2/20
VDTAALRALLSGCGAGLTSLQLNGCVGVGGEALVGLGAACPRLARLNLRGLALQDWHLRDLVRGRGGGSGWEGR